MARITYFTDMEKSVVTANFIKRGWTAASTDEEWNFYWFLECHFQNTLFVLLKSTLNLQGQHSNLPQFVFSRKHLSPGWLPVSHKTTDCLDKVPTIVCSLLRMINHFPNHYELTRKDLMVKNIKRYKREQDKERETKERSQFNLEFVPVTFVLPADYNLFAEEYRRCPTCTWIMKVYNSQNLFEFSLNIWRWKFSHVEDLKVPVSS